MARLMLNLGARDKKMTSRSDRFISVRGPQYTLNKKLRGTVWTFWRREKPLVRTRIRTPDLPACSL